MPEQLVSHSAGYTRFGRDAEASADELGPLADLVGTWIGSGGWELIAVPSSDDGTLTFRVIIRPYVEIVTFIPIGAPVPDRGGPAGDLLLTGLKYEMRIADAETNEPLHLENGMWFYMAGQEFEIARSSAIPHGDCLLALGSAATSSGPPELPELNCLPDAPGRVGYAEQEYRVPEDSPFQPADANQTLRNELAAAGEVVETVTLDVSTTRGTGGVLNIPFVTANANASAFASTYWIETVRDSSGQQFQQLQYSQQTNIDFLPVSEDDPTLIMWPHVNVNTLRKQ